MADSDYISRFSGEEVDQRLAAVATIQAALESLTAAVAAKYSKPAGGIPETDLDADVRAALALARSAVQSLSGYYTSAQVDGIVQALELAIAAKYSIPSGGIPASDLASAVQASLGKADTAYQKPASGIPASDLAAGVIPDVSGFVTKSVNDLVNYYLKSETYTKAEVQQLIAAIQGFSYEVVASLPTASADTMGVIYLVPSSQPKTRNVKDEYITIDNGAGAETRYTWEQIGSTAIDLTGYVTTTQLNTALADYTTTANLTTLLAAKQDTISDLAAIRSGAAAGATAYQKPPTGIPASDLAAGVIPTVPTDVVKYSSQSLTDAQKSQARTNIAAAAAAALGGYYTKSEIDALLSAVNSQEYVDVTALPTASASTLGKIYLVGPDADNQYARYYTSYDGSTYSWVPAGSTEVNLINYVTKDYLGVVIAKVNELITKLVPYSFYGEKPNLIVEPTNPVLVYPSEAINVGAIGPGESAVSKTVFVLARDVTQPVAITVTGTGFTVSTNSIPAADLLAGVNIVITYSSATAGQATGSIAFSSSEIDETFGLTASNINMNYVTSGLVLHLDGREKGNNANAWTDKVGGIVFTNDGATSIEKGWSFDGTGGLMNNSDLGMPANGYTIEVAFRVNGANATRAVFHNKQVGGIGLGLFYEAAAKQHITINCNPNSVAGIPSFTDDTVVSGNFLGVISGSKSAMLVNGEQATVGDLSTLTNGTRNTVGGRYDNSGGSPAWRGVITGEVYAVRIYSRELTTEERLNNLAVDNLRYDLGLTLPE